jgi:hypothetical protein
MQMNQLDMFATTGLTGLCDTQEAITCSGPSSIP